MKIIDGKNAILGRLASYVAKEALKGEEFAILNCEQVIVTGSKQNIQEDYEQRRRRVGTLQVGPKVSISNEKIVKRAIRGMFPTHREGRGRDAYKRIKCYVGIPKEFEKETLTKLNPNITKIPKSKFIQVKDIY
jgi:large subunit ribosomal protein L13